MVAPGFEGIDELDAVYNEGYHAGKSHGWVRGFAWGIFLGMVIAALIRWLVT